MISYMKLLLSRHIIAFMAAVITMLLSCTRGSNEAPIGNAIYYWRTTLSLSPQERATLGDLDIRTLYLHMFDIREKDGELRPTSTLVFNDTIPENIEIVPVVFIEPSALNGTASTDSLADRIISRVDRILTLNGYPRPSEVQIDFDWTLRNRAQYYDILQRANEVLHSEGRRLSTTIRLHQLSQPVPPVDYGVLMVYNVGRITNPDETNSILSRETVRPYLKALHKYTLPLATALPVYSWDIVFSDNRFKAIAHSLTLSDTTEFHPVGDNWFRTMRYGPLAMAGSRDGSGGRLFPGDMVRHEFVTPATISAVRDDIRHAAPYATKRIILYHLDEKSLNQYDTQFLQTILDGSSRR